MKFLASAALFAVAGRPDGGTLLNGHIDAIGHDLLTVQDERLQNGEIMILGRIRPTPPQVVPLLLKFLKQADRGDNAKAGAVVELIRIAPDNDEAATEILQFLSQPLAGEARIGVLNALGNPKVHNPRLVSAVISYINSPDEDIRSTAVQATGRIGKTTVEQAEPLLRKLGADPSQPPEIRQQAKQTLTMLQQ